MDVKFPVFEYLIALMQIILQIGNLIWTSQVFDFVIRNYFDFTLLRLGLFSHAYKVRIK